ncbi:hypothetical protein [Porphyromonas somerae]|uniref:hypothetical protein n=1 Tax=Porphyromonas somerae TaxID=322095 RepID=UPI001FCC1FD3|nr:hypothetical protein [Porphyromonas somerae]BDE81307.1 hypothetical protein CE91St14_03350 [Porphyromonas somerae]
MKESKQLKVTDLRIGDKEREKKTGFEFIVTGIIWNLLDEPTKAELYLDENGGEFVYKELDEVELVEEK